jgi:hypothetical protein
MNVCCSGSNFCGVSLLSIVSLLLTTFCVSILISSRLRPLIAQPELANLTTAAAPSPHLKNVARLQEPPMDAPSVITAGHWVLDEVVTSSDLAILILQSSLI